MCIYVRKTVFHIGLKNGHVSAVMVECGPQATINGT